MTGRWKDGIVGVTVSPAGGMGSIMKEWGTQETWDAQEDDVRGGEGGLEKGEIRVRERVLQHGTCPRSVGAKALGPLDLRSSRRGRALLLS